MNPEPVNTNPNPVKMTKNGAEADVNPISVSTMEANGWQVVKQTKAEKAADKAAEKAAKKD
jgi:hypothetical protein